MEIHEPIIQVSVKLKWRDEESSPKEVVVSYPLDLRDLPLLNTVAQMGLDALGLQLQEQIAKKPRKYLLVKPAGIDVPAESLNKYLTDIQRGVAKGVSATRVEVHGEGDKRELQSITFFFRHSESK